MFDPLLFLIYINDIPQAATHLNCIMYADDTTLFSTFQSFKTSTKEMNLDTLIHNELAKINEWLKINKLSLNVNKSKYILYKMINKALNIPAGFLFKCGYSRDYEPQSRDHLSYSAYGQDTTYHRSLWIHQELIM